MKAKYPQELDRIIDDFNYFSNVGDEHTPTAKQKKEQKQILRKWFKWLQVKRKRTWLYLVVCAKENHFRLLKDKVERDDLFLDEAVIHIEEEFTNNTAIAFAISKKVKLLRDFYDVIT